MNFLSKIYELSKNILTIPPIYDIYYNNIEPHPAKKTITSIISCDTNFTVTKKNIDSYFLNVDDKYNYALIVMDNYSLDDTMEFFMNEGRLLKNTCYCRYRKNTDTQKVYHDGGILAARKIKSDYIYFIKNNGIILEDTFKTITLNFNNTGVCLFEFINDSFIGVKRNAFLKNSKQYYYLLNNFKKIEPLSEKHFAMSLQSCPIKLFHQKTS
ncbi:hypothetical protein OMAG_002378 [Candidatus Omnitrophus magneticus]|uniref:Uncharacterized protein n=1 Tax=Candidatus Omnitrophus magneticus TaxID=1609969 RepID=A0A0F0CNZ8_9BACT|nr:hypothetical protein OMAG_002378 [Candidatus Omnitrophus magneticus]